MNMLYFRSCQHCKTGTVMLDWDRAGTFFECLNCGWMLELSKTLRAEANYAALVDAATAAADTASCPAASALVG